MLNANRVLIFLFIGIFSSSLYAVDISKFDIKGMKLGMNKNEVLKKMPCSNPKTSEGYWGYVGKAEILECNKEKFEVHLDHKGFSYIVRFYPQFDVKPNFNKLENRLIKRYGETKYKSSSRDYGEPSLKRRSLCWGICKIHKWDGGVNYEASETTGLSATFIIWDKNHEFSMSLILSDGKRAKVLEEYSRNVQQERKRIKKEKASNIDF